ncbi:MAG TPA: sulfate ABC transporter substrate-binding protein [Sporichthya sp.]|nr:sulfate ABC transporter substrate-binding protein [Sporichthya sp.]
MFAARPRGSRPSARRLTTLALPLAGALLLAACSGGSSDVAGGEAKAAENSNPSAGNKVTLNLVAYSVPKAAFDVLIPAFQATEAGKNVEFASSYGPSGDQSRKVADGLATDIVNFANEPDITRLVDGGLVDSAWNSDQHKGIPSTSVVTLVVRKGNPKGIKNWDDIVKDGVEVVTPNPFSSGGAKWNLLAPYALKSNGGQDTQAGLDFVTQVVQHTKAQPKSAREATELFESGQGDVLLSYESEATIASKTNSDIELVVPPTTFKIETPLAIVTKGQDAAHKAAAEAFRDFLYSEAGQKLWAETGFRPVLDSVTTQFASSFPTPEKVYSITDLGGWSSVNVQLFDPKDGTVAKIYDKVNQ